MFMFRWEVCDFRNNDERNRVWWNISETLLCATYYGLVLSCPVTVLSLLYLALPCLSDTWDTSWLACSHHSHPLWWKWGLLKLYDESLGTTCCFIGRTASSPADLWLMTCIYLICNQTLPLPLSFHRTLQHFFFFFFSGQGLNKAGGGSGSPKPLRPDQSRLSV